MEDEEFCYVHEGAGGDLYISKDREVSCHINDEVVFCGTYRECNAYCVERDNNNDA